MQLLTFLSVGLSAISVVFAAPQRPGRGRGGRGRGRISDFDFANFPGGRIGGTGPAESRNTSGGNTSGQNVNSEVAQSSTSCANGQVVCCNDFTNVANADSSSTDTRTFFPQYQFLLEDIFRSRINVPTVNKNREKNTNRKCTEVTSFDSGSASPICQQTVACCSGNQGPSVANVGCTAMNIVVNTGNSPVNGFFKEKE
ncbi:hypothetical protein ABW19_dt0205059 [Dactylella cylindrospora]|nr:hypothetical protein ABW19_dt0205059 [Dactylella cylindrospora]